MNPRVKEVVAMNDYKLILTFKNDRKAIYDCKDLLEFGIFKELKDVNYFKTVFVEYGSVAWSNGQDICPDTLYLESKEL